LFSLIRKNTYRGIFVLLLLCASLSFISCAAPERKPRVVKGCLDCHTTFAEKYMTRKNVHAVVKEQKCEVCHLRHGIVPKLILKKKNNDLCYTCHEKENMGMDRPVVHTAIKIGRCTACHDPHASTSVSLLKTEVGTICYQCHKREDYEKKVVHKVLQTENCATCHFSHASDEPNLLVKNEVGLCLSCHDSSTGNFRNAHGNYPVETSSCSSCHNPHSSLQAGLLKTSIHPIVAQSDCNKCHTPSDSVKPFATLQDPQTLRQEEI